MAIKVSLKIGPDPPPDAGESLIRALRKAEVTRTNSAPSGFQLTFNAERYTPRYTGDEDSASKSEWPILSDGTLTPFNRVQLSVNVDDAASDTLLIDGFITRQEINMQSAQGDATLVVTGEDVSVKMDLFEISAEYQDLKTSAIVSQILGKYSSLGITADVKAPTGESVPTTYIPQQNCTDRFYLQMLAAQNGFEFYVTPGSSAGQNTAYWGPPTPNKSPQPSPQSALIAELGSRNNILSLTLSYDALAATLAYAKVLDLPKFPERTEYPYKIESVAIAAATQLPGLSTGSAIPAAPSGADLTTGPDTYLTDVKKLAVRGRITNYPGYPLSDATKLAQAKTDLSVIDVITLEGEIDTVKYGRLLEAPGLVDVLGIGTLYGGTFVVKEVTHRFEFKNNTWESGQKFVLTRGATGYKSPPAPTAS